MTTVHTANLDLTTLQTSIFSIIRHYIERYGKAFPTYATIAKQAGCTREYAIKVIRKLETLGCLRVIKRERGSNLYEILESQQPTIVEPPAQTTVADDQPPAQAVEPAAASTSAHCSPYKDFYKDLDLKPSKNLKNDDDEPVFTGAARDRSIDLQREAQKQGIGASIVRDLLHHAAPFLGRVSKQAVLMAVSKFSQHVLNISHFGPWFAVTVSRTEDQLQINRARCLRTRPAMS